MEIQLCFVVMLLGGVISAGNDAFKSAERKTQIRNDIDDFINGVMDCYNLPGLSLSVVMNDEVLITEGYGVKDLETEEEFTKDSVVVIASLTKAFVGTVVGQALSKHSQFNWDTPVRDILGDWFYLIDPHVTTKVTIRDLLAHSVGIPRHDPIRIYGYTTHELMEKLRFLEFQQEWREGPHYNNLLYGLVAYVAEKLEGGTLWEDLATENIFVPLDMSQTMFVHTSVDRWDEFAKAYDYNDQGELQEISLEVPKAYYDTTSAPGGISSTATDMAAWILYQLSRDPPLLSAPLFRDTHRPVMVYSDAGGFIKPDYPETFTSEKKSLGWNEGYYRGYLMSSHTGSQGGYLSLITVLPDAYHGVYCTVTGPDSDAIREMIHMYILDLLLGEEPFLDVERACEASKSSTVKETVANPGHHHPTRQNMQDKMDSITKLKFDHPKGKHITKRDADNIILHSRPLEEYVGLYGNFAYSNASIYLDETSGLLHLNYGKATYELTEKSNQDEFAGQGLDIFWYWSINVDFIRDAGDITAFNVNFDANIPPTFTRGLDMADAPPPPELCD